MDAAFFKVVGAVAGIGGIALASVVYIFREVIRRDFFPRLTRAQAYSLLNRIVVLSFAIGVCGIVAYVIVNWRSEKTVAQTQVATPTPTPKPEELHGTVYDKKNDRALAGAKVTLTDLPGVTRAETSSEGVFILTNIPRKIGDRVKVRVEKDGYETWTEDVVLGKTPPEFWLSRIP